MNLKTLLRQRNPKPDNKTRNRLEAPSRAANALAFPACLIYFGPHIELWLPWAIVFPIALGLVLRKARQRRLARTRETLLTLEEREWWLRERRRGMLLYIVLGGVPLGLVMATFFALYPLLSHFLFGSPLIPLRESIEMVLEMGVGFFLCGCIGSLLAWITYQDDEREWQRKHSA